MLSSVRAVFRGGLGFLGCMTLAAVALPTVAVGQDAPPAWFQLNVLDVEPSMVDEFVDLQAELSEAAKKEGTPWRTVSRTEVFGNSYRFYVARPFDDFASLGNERSRSGGQVSAGVQRLRRYLTARQSFAVLNLQDVSDPLPEGEQPDLMIVNVVHVAPGREQDYLDVMTADFFPHLKEAGLHQVTGSLAFGGEAGFLHVFYIKDFAELDKGSPVMQALGPAAALEVMEKFAGIVTSSEISLARLIPEASFGPEPKEESSRE